MMNKTGLRQGSVDIPGAPNGFFSHTDEPAGYSVICPDNWEKLSGIPGCLVSFGETSSESGIRANFLVGDEELPLIDLEGYSSKFKKESQKMRKDFSVISEEKLIVDDIPAIRIIYTSTEKGVPIKGAAILLMQSHFGWYIIFTSSPEAFDSHRPTFETIVSNFHLFGASRGEQATFVRPLAKLKENMRGWGIGLIILGIIQIAVSVLSTEYGIVLIIIGVINLIIPRRGMYIANGIALFIAGALNIVVSIEEEVFRLIMFAILQIVWGFLEIRKFFKYRFASK
jgi:hypothetical protein